MSKENVDKVLLRLVQSANLRGGAVPVVLECDGLLVSGQLVGRQEYEVALRDHLIAAGAAAEDAGQMAHGAVQEDNEQYDLLHVHVKNATLYTSGSTVDVAWWRGRLSDIDSLSLPGA